MILLAFPANTANAKALSRTKVEGASPDSRHVIRGALAPQGHRAPRRSSVPCLSRCITHGRPGAPHRRRLDGLRPRTENRSMPTYPQPIVFPEEQVDAFASLLRFSLECEQEFGISAWFRGQADYRWKLRPRIFRPQPALQHQAYEASMLNTFRSGAPMRHEKCPPFDDDIGWLILANHYGLPTRLLDWTCSVLVAAFFAVSHKPHEAESQYAVIWALNPCNMNEQQIGLSYILGDRADSVRPCTDNAFSHSRRETDAGKKTLAFRPAEGDPRIMAQQSAFTIHGTPQPLEQMCRKDDVLRKLLIPSRSKPYLRTALSLLGIRRSILFPDLEHLAEEVVSGSTVHFDHPDTVMSEFLQGRVPPGWAPCRPVPPRGQKVRSSTA